MPEAKLIDCNNGEELVVKAARVCYDSTNGASLDSDIRLLNHIITSGHFSVLEHGVATFYIRCSRVVSHELVRHRIASFSQRSQRYVNEDSAEMFQPIDDFENQPLTVQWAWNCAMVTAKKAYSDLIKLGVPKQIARYVLPNATMTEMIVTANFREWRHIIELRAAKTAQPEMQELAKYILKELYSIAPIVFGDLKEKYLV